MMSQTKDDNLMDQLSELESLLVWFEREDFDVEEGLKKYERGMTLVGSINQRLKSVENKVEVLKQRFDQAT